MPINSEEILKAISILADEHNIRVAVQQSGKGAAICGACSFVGGLMLGPAGLAAGGVVGGLMAYSLTKGSFRNLSDVINNDLSDVQKEELVRCVTTAINDIEPRDMVMILPLIMNNESTKQAALRTVVKFVSNELRMQIID